MPLDEPMLAARLTTKPLYLSPQFLHALTQGVGLVEQRHNVFRSHPEHVVAKLGASKHVGCSLAQPV